MVEIWHYDMNIHTYFGQEKYAPALPSNSAPGRSVEVGLGPEVKIPAVKRRRTASTAEEELSGLGLE